MENLYIAPSLCTPEVRYESQEKVLDFNGKSFPTDPVEFYKPIFDWLDKNISSRQLDDKLDVNFKLDYYNTSSSKQFAKFFKILEDSYIRDGVKINWFYDGNDLDMLEAGERFSQFTLLKFELKKNQSN